jgi:hypothetical protein
MVVGKGSGLAVAAFVTYIIGGIGTFGGLVCIAFLNGYNLYGMGDGRSIGYLFLCVGLCLSIMGVLMMRIFRNRGFNARR